MKYLQSKGANFENPGNLPKDEQKHLMHEASNYASLKLAKVESRAKFHHDIHAPS